MRYHERAPFVPIGARPKLTWPDKARLAVWIVPNIEYWHEDSLQGGTIATPAKTPPDIPNYSWRDYGARVGIWRMMRMLKELDIKGTVALNSDVCSNYPQVVESCAELGWEFMGHGLTNSASMNGLPEHQERAVIGDVLETIEHKTGTKPIGWLGQGLAESDRTLDILAENGVQYVGDWVNDEQPYPLRTTHGIEIFSMPYSIEINDIGIFMRRGFTGPDYDRMIRDQCDVLYEEAAETGKVMCIALHPYITGVPFRAKYLETALAYMREKKRVWFATGSEILAAYKAQRSP
jgi:peptidoglycan/xylan/chitin deacetylase (PgdA/CDA1 family)